MTGLQWEIHVSGVLPDAVLAEMPGLAMTVEPASTVLQGSLPDDAALHGVLERIQSLGLRLVEVRRLPDVEARPVPLRVHSTGR